MKRRMRSASVTVTMLAAIAALAAACDSDEADYTQICVNKTTELREPEAECDNDRSGVFVWFYYPRGVSAPAVGQKIITAHGSYTKPAAGVGGYAPARGGFGGRAGTTTGG